MLNDNQLLDVMFAGENPADILPEIKPIVIKLSIDPQKFNKKPFDGEIGGIQSRLAKPENQVYKSFAGLGEDIKNGQGWSACFDGNGKKKENFVSSQIIGLDFDDGFSLELALKLFSDAGININAWYYSFSHSDAKPKFRFIILLDKPIQSVEEFEKLVKALMRFCPKVDQKCKNADRYFNGSNNFTLLNDQPNAYEAILKACPVEAVKMPQVEYKPLKQYSNDENSLPENFSDIAPYFYNQFHKGESLYYKISYAIIQELGEAARQIFIDICSNQSEYNDSPERLNREFDRLTDSNDGSRTIGCYIGEAMKRGFKPIYKNKKALTDNRANNTNIADVEQIKYSNFTPEMQVYSDENKISVKDHLLCSYTKATDYEIARALHNFNGGDFIFNHTRKYWLKWNGKHWQFDEKNEVESSIVGLAQECLNMAVSATMADQKRLLELKTELESVKNWKNYSVACSAISGEIDSKFNSNKNLFNLKNGTFDLSNMQFRQHKKTDYLTDCMDYEYNQSATCERFLQFLEDTFNGNYDIINFLQRSIGYTLTGLSTEQHFFFLTGGGSNGKSVFIETIINLLGSYSVKIPLTSIMQTKNPLDAQRATARLQNKRLAVCNETEEGARLAESTIKDLTGGDTLIGTALYQSSIEFKPSHSLWIYGNHKPIIKGTDHGVWRRPLLIPFLNKVPEHKKDKLLISKLSGDLSGIFNWALDGLKEYHKIGLKPPKDVTLSTEEYKSAMDLIGNFLSECTEQATNARTSQKDLYVAFQIWQKNTGDTSRITSRGLTMKLEERGLPNHKGTGNCTIWDNLQLRPD